MSEFLLPDVGEGLTEAEIVAWKVKVGDTIEINDVIVEIETAKSLVELPSPYEGTVLALLVAEGETVPVGTPIISIGAEGEAAPVAPTSTPAEQTESDPYLGMAQKAGGGRCGPGRPCRHRPVQPGRVRLHGGRVPRRPDQGRAWPDAPRPSRLGVPEHRRRRPDPAAGAGRVLARRRPVAGRAAGRRVAGAGRRPAPRARGRPRRGPRAVGRAGRAQRRTCAGEAAGAQARQGPGCRPERPHRLRPVGLDHPRRRPGRCRRLGLRRCVIRCRTCWCDFV